MSTFVKICGLRTVSGVIAAANAGADAVGFVFAESPRRVGHEQARTLAAELPPGILRVAVFAQVTPEEIDRVCDTLEPNAIQADAASLRHLVLPEGVLALPVVRDDEPWHDEATWALYDSTRSGAGVRADWEAAAALARRTRVILAGGLDAGNVGAALRAVRPYGVDVSSGVEETRGIKSAHKIEAFVAAVRAAERHGEGA
jgi:phosphoribosylanthranilate isomerase